MRSFIHRERGHRGVSASWTLGLVALLLMTSLAGCTQSEHGAQEDRRGNHGEDVEALSQEEAAGLIPIWFSGLVFQYEGVHHATGQEGAFSLLVLEGPGEGYTLEPLLEDGDGEDEDGEEGEGILPWLLHEGVPVGPVREEDFEPRLDDEPLDWFSFPIRESDTWEGVAPDGEALEFSAKLVDVVLPNGEEVMGYEVTGRRDGTVMLEYVYTSWVGWFVSYWWDSDGDAAPEVSMEYTGLDVRQHLAGRPPREPVKFLDLEVQGLDPEGLGQGQKPGGLLEQGLFDVPRPEEKAWFVVRFEGGTGHYEANLTFSEEDSLDWQWTHDALEDREFWDLQSRVPQTEEVEARLTVLADGNARVTGYQWVPVGASKE